MKKKTPTKKWNIKPHKFITSIVKNERNPPKTRMITGYVGKSNISNCTRIYLDIELQRFVDIPTKDIIHYADSRSTKSPMGSVAIWVDEKTSIRHNGSWIATDDPTTMAVGEEGGGDPTTMATGEEGGTLPDPFGPLINPFGQFSH